MPETVTRATVLVSDRIQATGPLVERCQAEGTILHKGRNGARTLVTGKLVWVEGVRDA